MERETRAKLNQLTGFGVFAPFTVAFDAPLDLDEITRRHRDDGNFTDDAFFLLNVDPKSSDYLKPVRLDVGHGRYPHDLDQTDRYFPNDPRGDSPALLFETADEDLNANQIMDPGEDTDNDGVLDKPNVYPLGGDPREDLLTWYERETNTLIVRPVVPLREETRYAVILTERLIGEDGEPVRSPWEYVHHLRQTEALAPAMHALPQWGLDFTDVAFGWTFTTGRVTGDLVDVRRGLDGRGPWPWLGSTFPPGVQEALPMHENDQLEDDFRLPITYLVEPIGALGLFGDSADALLRAYSSFGGDIIGGSYTSPNLLIDTDDGGLDDTDEWWKLDPVSGTMVVGPQRIPFTCVLPKPSEEHQPPYDVVLFGHGYGSSRFDMFGFGWAMNRVGMAACAIDYPGHGPTIKDDELEVVELVLKNLKLMPFLAHLKDARYRDVDNDGLPDSGADQWIADSFHTRDMVRQAAVDWSQLIKSLQACGSGVMDKDGEAVMSCDWDEDGTPDLGGEDAHFYLLGGSLGGINTAVTAAVEPSVTASVPIVGAGGLMDVGIRSPLTGVVEAVVGRLITPLIVGIPDGEDGLVLAQHVITGRHDSTLPFASLPTVPSGGEILVENLVNGESRRFSIPDDGRLRVPIPGDAADPTNKRILAGLPHQEPPGDTVYTVEDNETLGDAIEITVFDASGAEVAFIDTFELEVFFEGVTYPAGSPLVLTSEGLGHMRGSPSLRRLVSFTGMIIEGGDPIAYAPAYFERPFQALGGKPTNVLMIPTPGDMIVAVNAEIALARAAGLVNYEDIDPRYGMTVDQWLIDREVVRGLEQHGPWVDANGNPALFDPDDLDNGLDGLGVPSDAPLRVTRETDAGVSGMRLPYVSTTGSHGFGLPDPSLDFDINTFAIQQVARYFQTHGQVLSDDPCMEDHSCDWLRPFDSEEGR